MRNYCNSKSLLLILALSCMVYTGRNCSADEYCWDWHSYQFDCGEELEDIYCDSTATCSTPGEICSSDQQIFYEDTEPFTPTYKKTFLGEQGYTEEAGSPLYMYCEVDKKCRCIDVENTIVCKEAEVVFERGEWFRSLNINNPCTVSSILP